LLPLLLKNLISELCAFMPVSQIFQKGMYIEDTCILAIFQIPNEYRKIFYGSKSADLLEITQDLVLQIWL